MIIVRVPTGFMRYTTTASSTRYLSYRCCNCHRAAAQGFEISQSSEASYHVFSRAKTKEKRQDEANNKADELLNDVDEHLFKTVNTTHKYDELGMEVQCPYCGTVQPWSVIPKPWNRTSAFGFWIGMLLILLMGVAFTPNLSSRVVNNPVASALYGLVLAFVLAGIPLLYQCYRNKKVKRLEESECEPPIYVNKSNVNDAGNYINQIDDEKGMTFDAKGIRRRSPGTWYGALCFMVIGALFLGVIAQPSNSSTTAAAPETSQVPTTTPSIPRTEEEGTADDGTLEKLGSINGGMYLSGLLGIKIEPQAPVVLMDEGDSADASANYVTECECVYMSSDGEYSIMQLAATRQMPDTDEKEIIAALTNNATPEETVALGNKTWYKYHEQEGSQTNTVLYTAADGRGVILAITDNSGGKATELFLKSISSL